MQRVLLVLALLGAAAAGASSPNPHEHGVLERLGACSPCPDNSTCCDPYVCCKDGNGGYMCCDKGGVCCDGTCCSSDETCCNGTCCLKQTTYCCNKTATHPDRCCPRWMVCCGEASWTGCCDPGWLKAMKGAAAPATSGPTATAASGSVRPRASGSVFAMFTEVSTLRVLEVDAATGKTLSKNDVKGYNNYGELTRVFPFDRQRKVYYSIEANFSAGESPPLPVVLYSIDATTGVASSKAIPELTSFPCGFAYKGGIDTLVVATFLGGGGGAFPDHTGYTFWHINLGSGAVTKKSTAASLAGDFKYAGYFHEASADGLLLYRIGYRDVYHHQTPGIGITDLSGPAAKTAFHTEVPVPKDHGFYLSVMVLEGRFVSLSAENSGNKLDVVEWALNGTASVVVSLGDAHLPLLFGPVAEASNNATEFVAGVIHNGVTPVLDRWVLAFFDLTSQKATTVDIEPRVVGETASIGGLGVE